MPGILISLCKVETPVTVSPPPTILTPVLAVTSPTESTLVTSSYVNVPPTETLPVNDPVVPVILPPTKPPVDVVTPVTSKLFCIFTFFVVVTPTLLS